MPLATVGHVGVVAPNNTTKPPLRRVFDSLNARSGVEGSSVDFRTTLVGKPEQVCVCVCVFVCVCVCLCMCVFISIALRVRLV